MHQRTLGQCGQQAVALEHLARFAARKLHLIGGERRTAAGEQMARKVFDVDDVAGLETTLDAGNAHAKQRFAVPDERRLRTFVDHHRAARRVAKGDP